MLDSQITDNEYSTSADSLDTETSENADSLYSNTDSPDSDSVFNETTEGENNINSKPNNGGKIIDVDSDFNGNLENAIAQANDGDVVSLGSNTYYTDGIDLNKSITIDGQQGSVIDGGGTSESIIEVDSKASGATIQDVEITNGNNGIAGTGATNLTLENLDLNDLGLDKTIRDGQNNTAIALNSADGLKIINSEISNVGRKGIGIGGTDGAVIDGMTIQNINLDAQHAQSHDAGGIKLFNTNDVVVSNNQLSDINGHHIWNDTTNGTTIKGNVATGVGTDFLAPKFNDNVQMTGIYNEKSSNATVSGNKVDSTDEFLAFKATAFSTDTMSMENNDFSSFELNTTDYWVNKGAEVKIATTEDPSEADFSIMSDAYYAEANIG